MPEKMKETPKFITLIPSGDLRTIKRVALVNGLESVKSHIIRPRSKGSEGACAISNIIWSGRNVRKTSHFEFADFLALDVDYGVSIERAREIFRDYSVLIVATKSHRLDKNMAGEKVACDRFRVVIPFSRRITKLADYEATLIEVKRRLPFIDPSCTDAARFYNTSPGPVLFERYDGISWPAQTASEEQNRISEEKAFLSRHGTDEASLAGVNGGIPTLRSIQFPKLGGRCFFSVENKSMNGPARFIKIKRRGAPFLCGGAGDHRYNWRPSSTPLFRHRWTESRSNKGTYWNKSRVGVIGYDRLARGFIFLLVRNYRPKHWGWISHFAFGKTGEGGLTRVWVPYETDPAFAVEKGFRLLHDRLKGRIEESRLIEFVAGGLDHPIETVELLPAEVKGLQAYMSSTNNPLVSTATLVNIKKASEWKRAKGLIRRQEARKKTRDKEKKHVHEAAFVPGSDVVVEPPRDQKSNHPPSFETERIEFLSRAEDLFRDCVAIRYKKTLEVTTLAILAHPYFWTSECVAPGELKISQSRLVEIAAKISPRAVKKTTIREHLRKLEKLGFLTRRSALGFIPRQRAYTYTIEPRFINEVLSRLFNLVRRTPPGKKKKLLAPICPRDPKLPPRAGEWNEYIFRATNYFTNKAVFTEYFWRYHREFLLAKPDRVRQMEAAWDNHHPLESRVQNPGNTETTDKRSRKTILTSSSRSD